MADLSLPSGIAFAKAAQAAALALSVVGAPPAPLPASAFAPYTLTLAPEQAPPLARAPESYATYTAVRVPAQAVDGFLGAARRGASPETEAFLKDLPSHFDGQSAPRRAAVLQTLDGLAHDAPREVEYRRALQRMILSDELTAVEPSLRGRGLTDRRRAEVLAQTSFRDLKWYHLFTEEMSPPEGITYMADGRIVLNVKSAWEKLPSFVGHYRTLFTHEYTHRLQSEGEVSQALGAEIPAVSAEILRAVEVYGLEGMRAGMSRLIPEALREQFEAGRRWTRAAAAKRDEQGFYWKGFLPGAAFELARTTGRWTDAWEFHRRVSSGVAPAKAARDILTAAAAVTSR
jgi:hypothetical protein